MTLDVGSLYPWVVFLHIAGAFLFVLAHGVSAWVSDQLTRERDRSRITALLELSSRSLSMVYVGLLVLLVAGIAAGIMGGHFGRLWIWVALGVLIAVIVAMYALATGYYRQVRVALGMPAYGSQEPPPATPLSDEELDALLTSQRPAALALIGAGGLLIIIWLMVFKPF
jgi:cytochrome c-type biogenesis protein CcmH/NrfG